MNYLSNSSVTRTILHINHRIFRRYISRLHNKRSIFIWFSDLVLIHPIQPVEQTILNVLGTNLSDNRASSNLELNQIKNTWNAVIEDEERLRTLYNPKLYKNASKDLKNRIQTHYKYCITNAIIDTLTKLGYTKQSESNYNRMVLDIYKSLIDPENYYIPENIRKLLGILQLRKIKWGIIANSGPHFRDIMDHLAGVEKIRQENGDYSIRLTMADVQKPVYKGTHTIPVCNAIDDGNAKPQISIFQRALEETNKRLVVKSNSIVPLPEVYFIGSSLITDNNIQVLSSLSMKSVLLTESFQTPISDIPALNTPTIQSLTSFRIKDISELYYAIFPAKEAKYYSSTTSLNMISEATLESAKDSLSLLLKREPNRTTSSPMLPNPPSALPSLSSSSPQSVPSFPSTKERGISDIHKPQSKPEVLRFDDESLKPL